jgi:HEAT repeat protein
VSKEDCAKDLSELMSLLMDGDPRTRAQAARSLGDRGEQARVAVPILIKALADPVRAVRASSGSALCKIRVDSNDIPVLIEGLHDSDRDMRFWSARALATATPSPIQALPALLESLREEDNAAIRDFIRWALQAIGPASVAPLVELLQSEQPQLRLRAVGALGGGNATRASLSIRPLLGALTDPEAQVRQCAAQALGILGQEHAGQILTMSAASSDLPRALSQCLLDADARVRERAAWALMWLGADARPAADMLRLALADQDERTQRWAAKALEHISEYSAG